MLVVTLMLVSTVLPQSAELTDAEVDAAINAAKQPRWASLFVEAKGRFAAYYRSL